MPLASSGLYKLDYAMTVGTVSMQNTYWYELGNFDNTAAQEVADVFDANLSALIAAVLHDSVLLNLITCVNINTLSSIGTTIPTTATGALVGSVMQSFTAAPIRLNRLTRETRNGQKRVGPMREVDVVGNIFSASYMISMDALAAEIDDNMTLPIAGTNARPIIVRRQATPLPWTSVLYNYIITATAVNRVSSQVSRKFY